MGAVVTLDMAGHESVDDRHATLRQAEIAGLFQQAVTCFRQGRGAEAEAFAQRILSVCPEHAETHHLLGLIAGQRGHYDLADRRIAVAIRANPQEPSYLLNRGLVAQMSQRWTQALALYEAAIALNPAYTAAHCNRGHVLCLLQRHEEALLSYDSALRIDPSLIEAQFNQGNALAHLGRYDAALLSYERVLRSNPAFVAAYLNRGNVLLDTGRVAEALASYEEVLRIDPRHLQAHCNRGNALRLLGRHEDALRACETAIQLDPENAQAHNLLGNALFALQRADAAMQAYEQAIRLNPGFAEAHYNRGCVLRSLFRPHAALAAFDRALELAPRLVKAHSNRGIVLSDLGDPTAAESSYRRALAVCPDDYSANANLIFLHAANASLTPDEMLGELRRWAASQAVARPLPALARHDAAGRRLRVGYVSPDLRRHAVSFFFEPLLSAHDRGRFEIFCYDANRQGADDTTARLRRIAEHWREVAYLGDEQLARLIRADGIDILIDLAGHTTHTRLPAFAYRPAPVQAAYLGFFASTGLEAMDYWITDSVLHPPDTVELAVETMYRLPRCWVSYQPPEDAPDVTPRPDDGARVALGCFSTLSKLTPEVVATWCRILHELPDSRLVLMDKALGEQQTRDRLAERFACHAVPADRLSLLPGMPFNEYLAAYAMVDIMLDTFPRSGGTTTAEALWMGVPVVALAGQRYAGRISVSKLHAAGLQDLVAENRDAYVGKVVALARDYPRRSALRAGLREQMARSPLCDGPGLARAIESAYLEMWKRYWSGRPD